MTRVGRWVLRSVIVLFAVVIARSDAVQTQSTLNGHTVRFDSEGKLLSWVANQSTAYDQILALNTNFLLNGVPTGSNGLKLYYSYSYISPSTLQPANWPHNPAGLYAMFTDSGLAYAAYTGNPAIMTLVRDVLTHHLDNGMTPANWNWPSVPYASGDAGSATYLGAQAGNTSGRGDGRGVIQPDKIGELGVAFLKYYRYSGVTRFRDAAIQGANVLASHVRTGSATSSPWPFRVYAETNVVREDYTAHVIPVIRLFDELIRLGLGNVAAYQSARQTAFTWLMTYPMQNNVWSNYFEDVEIQSNRSNYNQLVAGETARYLMEHPEVDSSWQSHVRGIITWIENTFGEPSFGALSISEQMVFHHPMGSHTSRYASINAKLFELTGDLVAKEKAYRAFNWATYMCGTNGRTIDGPEVNNMWFTDGFGDYIKHFMAGLGAVPEWAPPAENHLLRSTSIVKSVTYAADQIAFETADPSAQEVLRLAFTPQSVTANGVLLPLRSDLNAQGWTYDVVHGVIRVRHDNGAHVIVSSTTQDGNVPPSGTLTVPSGTSYTAPASIQLKVAANDPDGEVFSVDFRANSVSIGQVFSPSADGSYEFTWTNVPGGDFGFTAVVTDDNGASGTSNTVNVTVEGPPNASPAATITSPANDASFTAPANISFSVSASDSDGTLTKIELIRSGTVIQTLTPPLGQSPFTLNWTNVAAGDYTMTVRVTDDDLATSVSPAVVLHVTNPPNGLPSPWLTSDVGAVALAGSATHANGVFTVRASGVDIWGRTDQFRYVYQTITGDADIRARVVGVQNTNVWAKAGVMIRETLTTGSRHAVMAVTPASGIWFGVRTTTGGTTSSASTVAGTAPYWVRLVRQGNTFRAYRSTNGTTWTQSGATTTITMASNVYVGLALTSHDNTRLNTTTFESVSIIAASSDTTPPTAPTNPVTTFISGSRVDIAWTAATDNDAVASYSILRNGTTVGTSTTTSYSDTTVANGTHYDYTVRAVDRTGNIGPASTALGVTTPDTQGPTVNMSAPANGATVLGSAVTVSATATDNVGVTSVQFLLDGVALGQPDTSSPFSISWNTLASTDGPHSLSAIAQDAAGNSVSASPRSVTVANSGPPVDSTPPTVSLTSPAAGTVSGVINVNASAGDAGGIAGVQFVLDGVNLGQEDTSAPYGVTWDTRTVSNGSQHVLSARARDAAGNTADAVPVSVTVSNSSGLVVALSFDENTGNTATDSSGFANHASLASTTWTTGRYGSGLSFNGSSSRGTVADSASIDLTNQLTLEAWVRPTALSAWTTILLKERGTGGLSYALYGSDNTNRPPAGYLYISGDRGVVGTGTLPLNTWSHVAVTYDGSNMRLYVNGTLVSTRAQTGSTSVSTGALRIGSNAIWGEYFNGVIDEVRIYNRPLSAQEIQSDMNTRIRP